MIQLWAQLTPQLQTALIAGLVALLTSAATGILTYRKFRREYALEFAAETLLMRLLTVKGWEWRSFEAIKRVIGGFDDDELRRMLVRSGAFRGYSKDGTVEMWSHISKNPRALPPAK
jgi:hypothetical protein